MNQRSVTGWKAGPANKYHPKYIPVTIARQRKRGSDWVPKFLFRTCLVPGCSQFHRSMIRY